MKLEITFLSSHSFSEKCVLKQLFLIMRRLKRKYGYNNWTFIDFNEARDLLFVKSHFSLQIVSLKQLFFNTVKEIKFDRFWLLEFQTLLQFLMIYLTSILWVTWQFRIKRKSSSKFLLSNLGLMHLDIFDKHKNLEVLNEWSFRVLSMKLSLQIVLRVFL